MNRIALGVICGLSFDAASMLPMSFEDKRAAVLGAFLDKFAIGFLICVANLPLPGWLAGVIIASPSQRGHHQGVPAHCGYGSNWRDLRWHHSRQIRPLIGLPTS